MPIIVNELVTEPTAEAPPEPVSGSPHNLASGDTLMDELLDQLAIQRERQERLNID